MSDLADAIEAAALAMYFDARSAQRNRDMAERAIAAAAPLIEAQVRAKVAEEIQAARRTGITALLEGGWNHAIETAAAIARGHALDRPQIAVGATEPGGGSATKDDTRDDRQEQ